MTRPSTEHLYSAAVGRNTWPPEGRPRQQSFPDSGQPIQALVIGKGRNRPIRTLLVGTGRLAIRAVRGLQSEDSRRALVGTIDTKPQKELNAELPGIAYLGGVDHFADLVVKHAVEEVCVALPVKNCLEEFEHLNHDARRLGIPVSLRLAIFNDPHCGLVRLKNGAVVLEFNRHIATHSAMRVMKRALDLFIAGVAVALLSPFSVLIALAIKMTSRGPVLFRQPRVGLGRRVFHMFKFRTMVANAEELRHKLQPLNDAGGISFKIFMDPRVTRVGRFLRRTSLDELPQLLNVIKGEMSLVGPRPIPVWVADQLDGTQYNRRFTVLPGITGLWQVKGRVQDFDRMAKLDLEYIDGWSLGVDVRIIAATFPAMLRGENAI